MFVAEGEVKAEVGEEEGEEGALLDPFSYEELNMALMTASKIKGSSQLNPQDSHCMSSVSLHCMVCCSVGDDIVQSDDEIEPELASPTEAVAGKLPEDGAPGRPPKRSSSLSSTASTGHKVGVARYHDI